MNADEFRAVALRFPETSELSHMGHPDFRVGGKIFATLGAKDGWGMAKLSPEQQEIFLRSEPNVFEPASGAWGRGGATMIKLANADELTVRRVLIAAWCNTAPKALVQKYEDDKLSGLG